MGLSHFPNEQLITKIRQSMEPHSFLKNEIVGDLWRGGVGFLGSTLAVMSSTHKEFDDMIHTAAFVVGFLSSVAMLVSICQRIYKTHKEKDPTDER